jgi:hypothetical protein
MKRANPFRIGGARLALIAWLFLAVVTAVASTVAGPVFLLTNALSVDQATVPGNLFSTAGSFGGATWLATGSYLGDGADNRAITGVGFPPDLVLVKCQCNRPGVARASTMTGDASKTLNSNGGLAADLIQSLDPGGFTLGQSNDVNRSGETYHWAAMQAGAELALGTYLGDGADNRSIGGLGFQPRWVATLGDGNDSMFRPGSAAVDVSYAFSGTGGLANRIQQMEPAGFQVGSNRDVNQLGATYHYLAWRGGGNVSQSTYAGDGNDNRSITTVGWRPTLVWVKEDTASQSVWRPDGVSGDLSLFFAATAASNNRIQALEPLGFQVGSNNQINRSGRTYHYLALRDGP